MRFDRFSDYFDNYAQSDEVEREIIMQGLLEDFEHLNFTYQRIVGVLYEDDYCDNFNITREEKQLYIKHLIPKMLDKYLMIGEYEDKVEDRQYKSQTNIKDSHDTKAIEKHVEDYVCQFIFFSLLNDRGKFKNPKYFQCKICGALFEKSHTGVRNTRQKYCKQCKKIANAQKSKKYRDKKRYRSKV